MAEITRHRLSSFAIESQRYVCMKGEISFSGSAPLVFDTSKLRGMVCNYGSHFEIYDSKGGLTRFVVPGDKVLLIQQIAELSHE